MLQTVPTFPSGRTLNHKPSHSSWPKRRERHPEQIGVFGCAVLRHLLKAEAQDIGTSWYTLKKGYFGQCQDHQCLTAASVWSDEMFNAYSDSHVDLSWRLNHIGANGNRWSCQISSRIFTRFSFRLSCSANLCQTLPLFVFRFVWGHPKTIIDQIAPIHSLSKTHADTFCLSLSTRSTLLSRNLCG